MCPELINLHFKTCISCIHTGLLELKNKGKSVQVLVTVPVPYNREGDEYRRHL